MSLIKKGCAWIGLSAAVFLVISLYANIAATEKSKKLQDPESRINLLLQVGRHYPFNDRTEYELGKAYFDLGLQNLGSGRDAAKYFQEAIRSLRRSLKLNPFSSFSHFHLAQSLAYAETTSSAGSGDSFVEYRKAAELAGQNSQIFYEVGTIFLSRWKELNDEEKNFSLGILKTIMTAQNPERMMTLMTAWDMNIQDYNVIEKILPDDPYTLKIYAKFLGEKSKSTEKRQEALSRAEFLEFGKAKTEYDRGENALFYYRTSESSECFQTCLDWLRDIKFYQHLTRHPLIDPNDYTNLRKLAHLNLAKSEIEEGALFMKVKSDLEAYLELEDQPSAAGDLQSYLCEKGLLFKNPEEHLDDLDSLEFQLRLYFKQSRYREIIRIGRILMQHIVVVPREKTAVYIRVLGLIGDAQQKIDDLYDAGDFYQKALDLDPQNLETLIRLRENSERLNNDQKVNEIRENILQIVSPPRVSLGLALIPKGSDFEQFLILDGRDVTLDLVFEESPTDPLPLVVVLFNKRVAWDGYRRSPVLSLPLKSLIGRNQLNVRAVNRQANLVRIDIR